VIHHGAFDFLAARPAGELPPELAEPTGPVVLFFGLLRPNKGIEVLLRAWRGLDVGREAAAPELWIVGRPRMAIDELRQQSPPGVRWATRFVTEPELVACFRRADLVVLPYLRTERFDFSGVLATAMAFGKATLLSDVGGFSELAAAGAARLVVPGDAEVLSEALTSLLRDPAQRERLAEGARSAARGEYSWNRAAERTVALYRELAG
jgi:glycosyltransferase involved in cell wall biosynthesis